MLTLAKKTFAWPWWFIVMTDWKVRSSWWCKSYDCGPDLFLFRLHPRLYLLLCLSNWKRLFCSNFNNNFILSVQTTRFSWYFVYTCFLYTTFVINNYDLRCYIASKVFFPCLFCSLPIRIRYANFLYIFCIFRRGHSFNKLKDNTMITICSTMTTCKLLL